MLACMYNLLVTLIIEVHCIFKCNFATDCCIVCSSDAYSLCFKTQFVKKGHIKKGVKFYTNLQSVDPFVDAPVNCTPGIFLPIQMQDDLTLKPE